MDAMIPSMTIRDVLFHLPRLAVCNKLSSFPNMPKDPLKILEERDDDERGKWRIEKEMIDPFEIAEGMRRYECGQFRQIKVSLPVKKPRPCAVTQWDVTNEVGW